MKDGLEESFVRLSGKRYLMNDNKIFIWFLHTEGRFNEYVVYCCFQW